MKNIKSWIELLLQNLIRKPLQNNIFGISYKDERQLILTNHKRVLKEKV